MSTEPQQRICNHLDFLYGKEQADRLWPQLRARLEDFRQRNQHLQAGAYSPSERVSERDAFLITYGDQISEPGCPPLQTLASFLETHLRDVISGVHILPFYPYSSDDGFSVTDYRQVDPSLGDWKDVARIGGSFRLMFDAVINHISRRSAWFQAFLRGEKPYVDYFIVVDPTTDLSQVVRPRALPLLTPVETAHGTRHVWTTFSEDQIDLNYANPLVLLEIIDLLLFYAERGAEVIRLDAIAYLWKEIGTSSIHLPQTHRVVKLFRAVLDAVAPGVLLITETNVPHKENISYFGHVLSGAGPRQGTGPLSGAGSTDEAQMVYQFPLAPLVLHTFHTGDVRRLTDWVVSLHRAAGSDEEIPPSATFFNFIASHDGIGVMPAKGLLDSDEIQGLIARTLTHDGQVSYKTNPDGSRSVYELNVTLFDALNDPHDPQPELDVRRFLASQVILLSLAGVPGIYVHSLFGSRNCQGCTAQTARARSINREKFRRDDLEAELADPNSIQHQVFRGYVHLLRQRRSHLAFHPFAAQRAHYLHHSLFVLVRTALDTMTSMGTGTRAAPVEGGTVLCLVNVSPRSQSIHVDPAELNLSPVAAWRDLIGGGLYSLQGARLPLTLESYQAMWLRPGE